MRRIVPPLIVSLCLLTLVLTTEKTASAQGGLRGLFGGGGGGNSSNSGANTNVAQQATFNEFQDVPAPPPPKAPAQTTIENPNPVALTEISKPMANRDLGKAKMATNAMSRRLAEELEDRLLDYVDEFDQELKRVAFSDLERDDVVAKFKKAGRDPMVVDQLETALIDLDPLAVQRACKKLELPTAEMESLIARVEATGTFATMKKKVQDGDSALTVNRLARKLQRDLKAVDLPQGKRLALLDLADLIVAGVRIRDAVEGNAFKSLPSGTIVDWPVGQVPVVFYPRIPKGQVFVLGSDCLLAGTDPNTDIVFGLKTVAEAMRLPVYLDVPPVPNESSDGKPPIGIIIRNPDDTGATITYKIIKLDEYTKNTNNGDPGFTGSATYSIAPGVPHRYPESASFVVEFSLGPGREAGKYTLRDGLFDFYPHPSMGWQLRPNTYEVTLDNSEGPNDFHYVIDNRRGLVPAGGTRKHTSNYPMTIRFDRGGGSGLMTKVINKTGGGRVWKVGVRVDDNYWDLFSLDEIPLVTN
jgi:hypothetical protein